MTTMPQSVRCSLKHTENKSITPSGEVCLLVSRRRPCPIERGQLVVEIVAKSPDRTGQLVVERVQELNLEHVQIRTLSDRQREQILAACTAEIRRHEFQADFDRRSIQKLNEVIESQRGEMNRSLAGDGQFRRDQPLLHEELLEQNWNFREAHEKSLKEMEELKKLQISTFDTIARRRVVEDQDSILELTGMIQELQNEIICMNDLRDFQDAESVRSGQSHVSSQPAFFSTFLQILVEC